jgi:LysR family glycine cleavage system transcriptional activator
MNSLVVFEVSARHLSFTLAAEELTITREAVSRHIRRLEDHLGVKLFLRLHRALELTDAGLRFQGAIQEALEGIRQSAGALKGAPAPATVTIVATIAISSFWLTPRLPHFREREPSVRIRMRTSDSLPDLRREGIDLGLYYGDGQWSGLSARKLFEIESFPVCSPAYLMKQPPLRAPGDLIQHSLLNLEGGKHSKEDWLWWLGSFQPVAPESLQIIDFDNYANVIQAAVEGQGVALGFGQLVEGLIARGSLIRPLTESLNPGRAAYLVTPRQSALRPEAALFVDWIMEEAAGPASGA